MTQEEQEIDWKQYLTTVIEHMFASAKTQRPGYNIYEPCDTSQLIELCSKCKNPYNPSHMAGCDHCFQLEFISNLTPIKIQAYISENEHELTNIIKIQQNWKRYQAILDAKKQLVITEYKDLFAHGELFVIDDYEN